MTTKLKCDGCGMMASWADKSSEPVCPTCGGRLAAQDEPATIEITRQMKPEVLLAELERCALIDEAPPTKPRPKLGSIPTPEPSEPEAFTLLHLEEAAEQARREHASSMPPPPAPAEPWVGDALSAREQEGHRRWFEPRIAIPALVIGVSLGALMGRLNADPMAAVTSLRHRVVQHGR